MRRHVLEVLAASHRPLGAYEIIDLVAARGPRPAPITIYRALDFLTAQGFVHRIESRNAFLACINNHASDAPVVFLLCDTCGAVGEAPSTAVAESLNAAAKAAGFTPKSPVIEITGICAHCRLDTSPERGRSACAACRVGSREIVYEADPTPSRFARRPSPFRGGRKQE